MPLRGLSLPRRFVALCVAPVCSLVVLFGAADLGLAQGVDVSSSPRVAIATRTGGSVTDALDAGPLPSSQRISLTLTLAPTADRAAALDAFLSDVATASSPRYHKWVTPEQFARSYGATPDQVSAAAQWAETNGLTVDAVSPAAARMSVSGSTARVEAALAVTMHAYQVNGTLHYAAVAKPSLPFASAPLFAAIDGLDDLPTGIAAANAALSLSHLAAIVDANATPIVAVDATSATGVLSDAELTGYRALFRQAAAQGMTMLISRAAMSTGFPANLPDVTAAALPGDVADTAAPVAARPMWQNAAGLPADGLRYGPDLTVLSLNALAETLSTIALKAGGRLGNVDATLYALAPTAGLYTQPDGGARWLAASGLGVVDLAKLASVYPAGVSSAQATMTSSVGSPIHGQSFALTVSVASPAGGATPTGTVTFTAPQAGFNSTSVAMGASGSATSVPYVVPGGSYTITATYSGDAIYASSTASLALTVQPEAANFTIAAPSTIALGDTVNATVTLVSASGVGTPAGSITVTPSGISGATPVTQIVTGSGGTATGSFSFTSKQAGTIALQATCTPSGASFTCYSPQTASTTVPQAAPGISLGVVPMTPTAGTPVTLTAAVTGVAGIGPTGSVQFFDGTTSLGFGSAPSATYAATLLPGQTHSLTAVYLGDANYTKATSAAMSTTVGTAATTTAVNPSATTALYGQAITLNVAVGSTATVNGTLPTGTLTFTGAGSVTSAPVSGGAANVSLNSLPAGTYTITTKYSGDANYAASTGNTVVLTVSQSTASLSTSISSTSFTTGSTSTLTATVTLPGNAQLPGGSTFAATVTGVSGASYPGTFTVNTGGNTGTGSVTIPAPAAGTYVLAVTCGTNSNFVCIPSSLNIASVATSAITTATTTVLALSPPAPLAGQAVTLTGTVSAAATATTPIAGSVVFLDGTKQIGSGTIAVVGAAAVATATATLTGTTHSLTAVYGGNATYATSTSTAVTPSVTVVAGSISLTSNVTNVLAGVNVTFTAVVGGSTAAGLVPTGTVTFYLAGTSPQLLGTATVGAAGASVATAVFSTSNLPAGAQTVYAVYGGDTNFSSVSSASVTIGLSDYNLAFIPQSLTLTRGQTGQATLILGIVNGFGGTVVFGCTPAPNTQITCAFSPTTLIGGGTTTMSIITTAPKSSALQSPGGYSGRVLGGAAFAALVCLLLPGSRRRVPLLLALLLGVGLAVSTGCSGGNFLSATAALSGGTPLGTTTVTINTAGSDGVNTVRHNYTYQVTIQ